MENLFKEKSQYIKIYLGKEKVEDPYEHNTSKTFLNPLPIRAIITDLTFAKIQYAIPGIVTDKAKELVVEKKYKLLLEKSYKIEIDREIYNGWKINNKMQIRVEGEYCRVYIYIKKEK